MKKFKQKIIATIFLTIFLFSSVYITPTMFGEIENENVSFQEEKTDYTPLLVPKSSVFGSAPWWDDDYEYRKLINITNPYSYDFKNFGVSLAFNYFELLQEGKIQSDLDDIRIVENGYLRNYYIVKDFPSVNYATVYFDTNVSQNSIETDTYMYFGNDLAVNAEADQPSESFGWVKNGDFELDVNTSDNFEPFGWYFSHNPVNEIMGVANPYPNEYASSNTSIQLFVNKLVGTPTGAERVAQGDYTYKWGTLSSTCTGGIVNDYAGTFFTYPFTVPNVDGGISLKFYRNIRTYRFEQPKSPPGPGAIDIDGYFIRIMNGSSGVYDTNPDNHDDADIDPAFGNYAESYDGHAWYNPSSKKWTDDTWLKDFSVHTIINDTKADSSADGDLTGYSEIDLTPYMGKEVFFEIGVWGDESNVERKEKDAFFQVDDLKFNYTLSASLNEVQARKSDITIIARDIDGRIIPNAEIFILNESAKGTPDYIVESGFTSASDGSVSFYDVLNGEYNITANYTIDSREEFVGNKIQQLNGTTYVADIFLNIWTIDFEVTDWDGLPLNYGYIEINESLGGPLIDTLVLDNNGKATFRWLSAPSYYFRVYYENEDYGESPYLLNESYITRASYNDEKFKTQTLHVNEENLAPPSAEYYNIQERVYTDGSRTEFGNKKIIKANITMTNMINQLTDISIYYIDKNNSTGAGDDNLVYFKDDYGFGDDYDYIELDIPHLDNAKLESENFEVYGLYIIINGENSSQCNGDIAFDFLETCNIYNRTNLSKLNIRVININELSPSGAPVDAVVKVTDINTGESIINLISDANQDGYAYGQINEIPFWFFKDRMYNFSINIVNITNANFNVTLMTPDNQWKPTSNNGVVNYNYTLYEYSSITFNIIFQETVNISNYDTIFFNENGPLEVIWGEEMQFSVFFNYTQDDGNTWYAVTSLNAFCTLRIKQVGTSINLKVLDMDRGIGDGNFSLIIDSSELSAGDSYLLYIITIGGLYPGYPEPNSVNFLVKVNSIPTDISLHDYSTRNEILDETITEYYNELVNISIKYSITSSGTALSDAELAYTWIGLDPISFSVDPLDNDYFTFTLNTSEALSTGLKVISISASFENYSAQYNFIIYLNILERKTNLNGIGGLVYLNPKILVEDAENFIFEYRDANTGELLGDLYVASFIWQELYENGSIIAGNDGSGYLTQNVNKTYTLDFDTSFKPVGFYYIYVNLQKENYESKSALINLEIILRDFDYDIKNVEGKQINVEHGTNLYFEITLTDSTRNEIPLEEAVVTLDIETAQYIFNETSPGNYTLIVDTAEIDTFFAPRLFAGTIRVQKANFTTQEIRVNINIKMEEIFPGMPTFYFILLISAIVGVAGSLITYRVIQQARIPKFVKKIRKVKGAIKSKKVMADSYSTRTKEQMMVKLYGDDWKELELSLEDILGVQDKQRSLPLKGKKLSNGGDSL